MTPVVFVLAALAGGAGAALRYLVDTAMSQVLRRRFPWGILLVNVTGSFALGLITTGLPDGAFVLGAGLLGGYTTFSTAMLDALALWADGERPASVGYLLGTFAATVLAALAGLAIGNLV